MIPKESFSGLVVEWFVLFWEGFKSLFFEKRQYENFYFVLPTTKSLNFSQNLATRASYQGKRF